MRCFPTLASPSRSVLVASLSLALLHCGGGNNTGPDGSMPGTDSGHPHPGTDGGSTAAGCGLTGTTTPAGHWAAVTTVDGEASINFTAVWASGPSDVYVVGVTDLLHYNGSAWSKTTQMIDLFGVGGSSASDVWVSGLTIPANGSGGAGMPIMLHVTGTGDPAPTMVPGTEFGNISMASATEGWAVGQGTPLHWTGSAWDNTSTGIPATDLLRGIFTRGPGDAYAVGQSTYHWDGTSWTAAGFPMDTNFYSAVWSNCAGDIWYGGASAYVAHYNGTAWAQTPEPGGVNDIYGMWGAAANDIWAVGNNGYITHFDGATWTDVTGPTTQKLAGVWGTSATDIWAVGDNGTVLHYTSP